MGKFEVRAIGVDQGRTRYAVVNTEDRDRPVAQFDDEAAAREHARKLEAGPLDWDEQEAWQDDWDDDDDD